MELHEVFAALSEFAKNKEMGGLHTKAPANQHTATLLQQPGGIFSVQGMDRVVVSAHVAPMGLGSRLPVLSSSLDDPRYGVITGFGPTTGAEPDYPCEDAPKGYMKAGNLTAQFGRVVRQTETIEVDKLLHTQRNSSTEFQLLNQMMGGTGILPQNQTGEQILTNVVNAEMVTVGVNLERKLSTMLWTGTPANNTAHGGYKEFPGLDAQIATGHKDADTGTTMPSVDSMIMNFGNALVDSTTVSIVEYISQMEYHLRNKAERTGLAPVQWAIVMRPEMWFELSSIWACRYLADGCTNAAGTAIIAINDDTSVRMRDEMRNQGYLTINGTRYPVITDDGIYEANNTNTAGIPTGVYSSAIYFVPLRVRGNFPATYWEHIDYRRVGEALAGLGQGARQVPFWTDNGRLLWVYRENGYCFDLQAKIEPRVVLRTPHLAAKIQGVRYSPFIHDISPFPDSPYWKNGGVSTRAFTPGQAVWR